MVPSFEWPMFRYGVKSNALNIPLVVIDEFAKFAGEEGENRIEMFQATIERRVRKETTKEVTAKVRKEDELRLLMALEKQGLNLKEIEAIMARFKAGK